MKRPNTLAYFGAPTNIDYERFIGKLDEYIDYLESKPVKPVKEPIYNVELEQKVDKEAARYLNKRIDELIGVLKKNGTAINENARKIDTILQSKSNEQ